MRVVVRIWWWPAHVCSEIQGTTADPARVAIVQGCWMGNLWGCSWKYYSLSWVPDFPEHPRGPSRGFLRIERRYIGGFPKGRIPILSEKVLIESQTLLGILLVAHLKRSVWTGRESGKGKISGKSLEISERKSQTNLEKDKASRTSWWVFSSWAALQAIFKRLRNSGKRPIDEGKRPINRGRPNHDHDHFWVHLAGPIFHFWGTPGWRAKCPFYTVEHRETTKIFHLMCHQMPFWRGIRCKTFLENYGCGCVWAVPELRLKAVFGDFALEKGKRPLSKKEH